MPKKKTQLETHHYHSTFRYKVSMGLKLVAVLGLIVIAGLDAHNINESVSKYIYAGFFGLAYGLDKDDVVDIIKSWFNKGNK
jgi:hypothetical protein